MHGSSALAPSSAVQCRDLTLTSQIFELSNFDPGPSDQSVLVSDRFRRVRSDPRVFLFTVTCFFHEHEDGNVHQR